jgi:hypothetical protein
MIKIKRRDLLDQTVPSPRLTPWGALMILLWAGIPILLVALLLDLLAWLIASRLFASCWGVGCLLQ